MRLLSYKLMGSVLSKPDRLPGESLLLDVADVLATSLDLDTTVSPGDHYNAKVDGQLCRFDGIHFSVFCAKLVEPRVLGAARKLLGG